MQGLCMDTDIGSNDKFGKNTSDLDRFIDQINKINQSGPGYIYIKEQSYSNMYGYDPKSPTRSEIYVKLVSAVPAKKGFFKNRPASVTVQLTDGRIVPLYDSYLMEEGEYHYGSGSVPYAAPSAEIKAELDRYASSPRVKEQQGMNTTDKIYATKYKASAVFYAQNDYEDMKALNELIEKENKRREEAEIRLREYLAELAINSAGDTVSAVPEESTQREETAQLASQIDNMFK